ncbi:hypothetical protein NE237_031866 [Protea cynaroides]|uniref:BURP domain-containing protein n=1 Tax=Protea cynaroides TaxID=273540 RepID=A0A9Q0R2V2_9MAGN|nr:hypothetical protein NE237_031866 [Protea cynaroides]
MASSLCFTLMTLILLLTFVSSTISSRTNRKEDLDGYGDHEKLAHTLAHGSHSSVPHMGHMMNKDLPAFKIFFRTDDLKFGRKMQLYFPNPPTSHFISREEADSIPFSLSKLSNILQIFSISRGSPEAEGIENTLRHCESKPVAGETQFCPTSLESMLDFVKSFLGSSSSSTSSSSSVSFNVLSTKIYRSPSQVGILENYTIVEEPIEIWVRKQVGCHPLAFPYAVFYCHQTRDTTVYKLSMIGESSGEKVEAVAVCHRDTADWNPNLVAFQVLGIKPGTEPVCHIFPLGNLLWISSNLIST